MSLKKNKYRICIFDFDGVLVDSYACLPSLYDFIAHHLGLKNDVKDKFIQKALAYEDEQDALGNYDWRIWDIRNRGKIR
ncbi:MAG: hypothetical protein QW040_03545 [Candidatus Aenigmatarchaeota archaeon]